ncbi:MAG: TolC family protein [Kofleriaceae bacterium]
MWSRLGLQPFAVLLLALGLEAVALAQAQGLELAELPTDRVLRQLIDESLAAAPELAGAKAEGQAQRERAPQAGALPDPMLSLGVQNDGFTSIGIGRESNNFVSIMAAQTFPWLGKRALRRAVAQANADRAASAVTRARLSIEAEVRRGYLGLMLTRERLALLQKLEGIWQSALGQARVRYEIGDGAQSDLLRAQLEVARLAQRRLGLVAEERRRVQGLNRLRAHPLDEPIAPAIGLRELPALATFDRAFSVDFALAHSPELAAARLEIQASQRAAQLADKSSYPDLTVSAGIMIRGTLPPMWQLTLGIPVPLYRDTKQRREVAERRASVSAAQSALGTLEQVLRLRVEERRAMFEATREVIALYDRGVLVQSEATTQSALAQYKVGQVPFGAVLDANAGFVADEEGYLQAIAAAHELLIADAELSLAAIGSAGAPPSGAMPAGAGSPPRASSGTGM